MTVFALVLLLDYLLGVLALARWSVILAVTWPLWFAAAFVVGPSFLEWLDRRTGHATCQ